MNKTLAMIDDLIALEQQRDDLWKQAMHQLHRDSQIVGESAMLQHLRNLKKLVEIEFRQSITFSVPDLTSKAPAYTYLTEGGNPDSLPKKA